jgi:signal transduction histidine kinase
VWERFRQVPLFAELADDDLARICGEAQEIRLEPGQLLFREGEWGDRAYVVSAGQVEVFKDADRREVLLAVRGAGEVIGEMALLQQEPRSASVRARTRTDLFSIPKSALDDLLQTSTSAARVIFQTLLRRVRETNDQLRHQERMAQLGTLTAGVAHELNNPAAAVQRAAQHVTGELERLLGHLPAGAACVDLLRLVGDQPAAVRSPLEVSDEEAAVEDWLADRGVSDAWDIVPALVEAGIGVDQLGRLGDGADLGDATQFLAAAIALRRSAADIVTGAGRVSEIVQALRSYSYLDRAPIQEVDVVQGLEDTLVLMRHGTEGIQVVREYEPGLPRITASGGELNQVWTNLIQNACDALAGIDAPTLTLRAHRDGTHLVVEVEDNGPGIPVDMQRRIFDAFYTTKPPGRGTGLGLHTTYRIVVLEHHGDLTLDSEPGRTTFRVALPIHPVDSRSPVADVPPTGPCEHLQAVQNTAKPDGGCVDCAAVGDTWVHLRFCVSCHRVGCCDDSPNRHASRHAAAAGHPVLRTREPGENWAWCVVHRVGVNLAEPPAGSSEA